MLIDLAFGSCDVHRSGSGAPPLMIHGALVDHALWDRIVPGLEPVADLLRPDLPIGAHRTLVTWRDLLNPEAIADALAGLLDALEVDQAAVIGCSPTPMPNGWPGRSRTANCTGSKTPGRSR